ncbi:MAG: YitT family protein [Rikenellaceae bacterium]
MVRKLKKQLLSKKQVVSEWSYMFLGGVIMSAAYVLFINPYKIVPGGVYGMGIVLHSLFPSIQVGTFGLLFDIPLLLLSLKVFGRTFGTKTVCIAVAVPFMMNAMTMFIGSDPATMLGGAINLSGDIMLACLFGGVVSGAGLGLIIRSHATSGGTDIVAMTLAKFTKLTFSRAILLVDSMVVLFGLIVFGDWTLPLYSIITIFVATKMIDFVIDGASYDKLLFIISEEHEQIRLHIVDDMVRGGTYIKSAGLYTKQNKEMIFVVVSRNEIARMQYKIHEIDPAAFVVVVNAYETFGDGFKTFAQKPIGF